MAIIKVISSFIVALPELLKLIKNIQKQIDEKQTDEKVKDDIRKINDAFKKKDADALNAVFSGD